MSARLKMTIALGALLSCCAAAFSENSTDGSSPLAQRSAAIDSAAIDARTTVLDAGSSPVALYGSARARLQNHYYSVAPGYVVNDRSWFLADGSGLELRLQIKPNRHATLWSGLSLNTAMQGGNRPNAINLSNINPTDTSVLYYDNSGFTREQGRHGTSGNNPANVTMYQDFSAGMNLRFGEVSLTTRYGGILWTQSSPLTIWTGKPRQFAWDFLPFEDEKNVGKYYADRVLVGEEFGEASMRWSKRAFQGISFESTDLAPGLSLNTVYGQFAAPDKLERESVGFDNQHDRYMLAARIGLNAQRYLRQNVSFGLNYAGGYYNDDLVYSNEFLSKFPEYMVTDSVSGNRYRQIDGFFKEPHVLSGDIKGVLSSMFDFHVDFALSQVETTSVSKDTAGNCLLQRSDIGAAPPTAAVYSRIRTGSQVSVQAEAVVIPGQFYSPLSVALPYDAFMPFGSNMFGLAKMFDGSPYLSNMAGLNLTLLPRIAGGRMKIAYGQHRQIESGRDIIFFPYRLNGYEFHQTFISSWSRWGGRHIDAGSLWNAEPSPLYSARLGDESYSGPQIGSPWGLDAGGIRGDYLSAFEVFVPYESNAQADSNVAEVIESHETYSRFVPQSTKWTFNIEFDGTIDISQHSVGSRPLLLSGYTSLNGISRSFKALAFDEKDMLLWGLFARFEPAYGLTDKFYLIGLAGFEWWKSDMAYMAEPILTEQGTYQKHPTLWNRLARSASHRVPIDYRDAAFGVGCDWDILPRTGLHLRYKYLTHTDVNFGANSWENHFYFGEMKFWF